MKIFILLIMLLVSPYALSISTGEIFYNEYSLYYENTSYEVNYCHKNHASLLKFLKKNGADLSNIKVLVIQQDKTKPRLTPQNGLYDNSYAWHVVLLYDGTVYDLNAKYSHEGVALEDYFPYVLGYDTKMSDVMLRVYEGNMFYSYFYNEDGSKRNYRPGDFIKKFLSEDALSPLITASMLKWY